MIVYKGTNNFQGLTHATPHSVTNPTISPTVVYNLRHVITHRCGKKCKNATNMREVTKELVRLFIKKCLRWRTPSRAEHRHGRNSGMRTASRAARFANAAQTHQAQAANKKTHHKEHGARERSCTMNLEPLLHDPGLCALPMASVHCRVSVCMHFARF